MTKVKICGIMDPETAAFAAAAGADAIGINFFPRSPRYVDAARARAIADAVRGQALIVGVFVDAPPDEVATLKQRAGLDCVQLHGRESPAELERFLPHAYKALRVRGPQTLDQAAQYGGDHILLDAYVKGEPGGTGERFDWSLAAELAKTRMVTLAGGLSPDNVADAIALVSPFCVDVASGVEHAPGKKDRALIERFIATAKRAVS